MLDELQTARHSLFEECVRVNDEFERARDALNAANEAYQVANARKQKYDGMLAVTDAFLRFLLAGGKP